MFPQRRVTPHIPCTKMNPLRIMTLQFSSALSLTASQVLAPFPNSASIIDVVVWTNVCFLSPACPGKRQWCPCSLWSVSSNVCLTLLSRTVCKCSLPHSPESAKGQGTPLKLTKQNRTICLARLGKYWSQVALVLKKIHELCSGHNPETLLGKLLYNTQKPGGRSALFPAFLLPRCSVGRAWSSGSGPRLRASCLAHNHVFVCLFCVLWFGFVFWSGCCCWKYVQRTLTKILYLWAGEMAQ